MKKSLLITACLFNTVLAIAQDETAKKDSITNKTLFKNPTHVGWYVSGNSEFTQISGKDAYLGGLSGGVIFDHHFTLGLGFYSIANTSSLKFSDISPIQDLYLFGGYGGMKLEYILFPQKVVFVYFPLLIGGGSLMYQTNSNYSNSDNDTYASDAFFVLEPGAMVGLNLIKFIRLEAGVTYRYTSNIDLPETSTTVFNNFNGVVSLRFGKF